MIPISMLPPSSHTSTSPARETVTLSTASSDESCASARSNRTSIRSPATSYAQTRLSPLVVK
jgi:hypothetical protein